MRRPALLFCLALSPLLAAASPIEPAAGPILRGSQCLDPQWARGWILEDNQHILVDAGLRKYRIGFAASCRALNHSPFLGFRGDPVSGRVCGGASDALVTRDYPCRIESMQLLSKAQYKEAVQARPDRRRHGITTGKSKSS